MCAESIAFHLFICFLFLSLSLFGMSSTYVIHPMFLLFVHLLILTIFAYFVTKFYYYNIYLIIVE